MYADLTAALQRCSRDEGLQLSATHPARVWRAGALGCRCSPCICDGCREPLRTRADALLPIMMSFACGAGYLTRHVRRRARWCRGGAGAMRQRCLMARAHACAPMWDHACVPSVQAMPDSSSHVVRCMCSGPTVPVVGGVNVLVDTAIHTYIHTYIQTQLTAQRGVPANTGRRHCARTVQLWTLRRPVSHIDERVPYGSGQQRALRLG